MVTPPAGDTGPTLPAERPSRTLVARPVPSAQASEPRIGPQDPPAGELRPPELLFRLGLLLGSALFLIEGTGLPWERPTVPLLAAVMMSALIVLTMVLQWRVLGDWRRPRQQIVLLALIVTLVIPLAASLSPQLGDSALPDWLEAPLSFFLEESAKIPGFGTGILVARNVLAGAIYGLILITLLATSGPGMRAAFAVIALAVSATSLFFYPGAETVTGLILLAVFFRVQWERPLLVPDRIRARLTYTQLDFLRELLHQGALSTGETKLYLDNRPAAFAELLDYGLVHYDQFAREVVPGRRLVHDPACETLEKFLAVARRSVWVLVGLVYFFLPDPIPGPIDDLIVMVLCSGMGLDWFTSLFGRRRPAITR